MTYSGAQPFTHLKRHLINEKFIKFSKLIYFLFFPSFFTMVLFYWLLLQYDCVRQRKNERERLKETQREIEGRGKEGTLLNLNAVF